MQPLKAPPALPRRQELPGLQLLLRWCAACYRITIHHLTGILLWLNILPSPAWTSSSRVGDSDSDRKPENSDFCLWNRLNEPTSSCLPWLPSSQGSVSGPQDPVPQVEASREPSCNHCAGGSCRTPEVCRKSKRKGEELVGGGGSMGDFFFLFNSS